MTDSKADLEMVFGISNSSGYVQRGEVLISIGTCTWGRDGMFLLRSNWNTGGVTVSSALCIV
jgi:hypothetical protein